MNDVLKVDDAQAETLMGQIVDEFLERRDRGERPDVEEYVRRHPQFADVLRQMLPAMGLMTWSALASSCPLEGAAGGASELVPEAPLGDYRLVREIGRGGMGVVYEAVQISLGRRVALKVLPFASALDTKQLQRFKNEAHAAAALHHQNIVPVYGVGYERGVHYYAMQFIDGQTLAQVIADMKSRVTPAAGGQASHEQGPEPSPPTAAYVEGGDAPSVVVQTTRAGLSTSHSTKDPSFFRTVAQLGIQAAEALEHSHGVGIVHRDIKPTNLLIDARGNLWITDFGLAQIHSDTRLTMTGDILGTLRYMSPEQALAQRVVVDHRTDVYSLGATLYELLTLEPVFAGHDRHELLREIAFEEPQRPRQMNAAIPLELETIVLKAVEKNPAERYSTAQELADDLSRFLKDEPIRARRPSVIGRARKWARRHRPVVQSALVAVAAVVTIAILALVISLGNISAALAEKSEALDREIETRYLQDTVLAGRELAAGNVGRSEELLDKCPEKLRGWEWHFLKRQRYEQPAPIEHQATVIKVAFSPNGRQIASVDMDGAVAIHDALERKLLHSLERQEMRDRKRLVCSLTYSPDSRYLALSRHDGTVRLWNAQDGQPLPPIKGHEGPVWQTAFSADSQTLVTGGSDGTVRLWDVKTTKELRTFAGHPAPVKGVAFRTAPQFAPSKGRERSEIIAACDDGVVKIWDRDTGREVFSFRDELKSPWVASFSKDARRLGWSCLDGVVKVWDTTTGKLQIDKQSNTHQCRAIVFHPDGKRIALCGFDGTIRLLDAENGREMLTIFAHTAPAADVVFNHDGNKLASGSYDHSVRIWDATRLPEGGPILPHCLTLDHAHREAVSGVHFSPDGRWLASSSWDNSVKVWECEAAKKPVHRYTLHHSWRVVGVAFSPDNRTIATGSWDKTVKLWDLQAPVGKSLTELRTISRPQRVTSLAFNGDGRVLAVGQPIGIALHNPFTGKQIVYEWTPTPVPALAFDPKTGHLASASASDPAIRLWELIGEELKQLPEIRHYSNPNSSVAFSPDGRLIACQGREKETGVASLKVWDVNTRKVVHVFKGHALYVWKVAFSPDGRYLASGSWDSTIKIWDLKTGEEAATLRGHAGIVHGLAFNQDGSRLASGSGHAGNGEVMIWDDVLWKNQPTRNKEMVSSIHQRK